MKKKKRIWYVDYTPLRWLMCSSSSAGNETQQRKCLFLIYFAGGPHKIHLGDSSPPSPGTSEILNYRIGAVLGYVLLTSWLHGMDDLSTLYLQGKVGFIFYFISTLH
ncbi:hypothetical protein CDAR_251301 [Caerostris darwini]|uniref:Uncharacterized protein n=1 Tax=Caerostris darwini TaxID=1538125 RepID=A0AAV4R6S9_9ARAC|nr:hypothetical protein CDAR_251301 [Caerostris darwini]